MGGTEGVLPAGLGTAPEEAVPAQASAGTPLPRVQAWGAAHVKSRTEKKFAEYLQSKKIPYFLPLLRRRNVGTREIRWFLIPLFPGYVFYDVGAVEDKVVYASHKVATILRTEDQARLRKDLENVARALRYDDRIMDAIWPDPGRPVRVARGPFEGLSGELVKVGPVTQLVIRVHFIRQALGLEVGEGMFESEGS